MAPLLFISHGGPGSILKQQDKETIKYWRELGQSDPFASVAGVVCVSAHWFVAGNSPLQASVSSNIIYDFGEFYPGIYNETYPFLAPPAKIVNSLIGTMAKSGLQVTAKERGLDHGTWTPFKFMFPNGKMPILQIQLPFTNNFDVYTSIGKSIREFADENNYAIIASGGITHNLQDAFHNMEMGLSPPPEPAAIEFVRHIHEILVAKPNASGSELMAIIQSWPSFLQFHPTLDHFIPILVAHGARTHETIALENTYWSLGSLSLAALHFQ